MDFRANPRQSVVKNKKAPPAPRSAVYPPPANRCMFPHRGFRQHRSKNYLDNMKVILSTVMICALHNKQI